MCADKVRRTQPLKITFSDGEQPTASKLTAIAAQSRSGSNTLEYAIGDLWNDSGDTLLSNFELQIPNIARMIGQNKLLNPALYNLHEMFQFTELFGARNSGKRSGFPIFKPAGSIAIDVAGSIIGGIIETSDPANVDYNTRNTYYNSTTNKLEIFAANGFGGTEELRYTVISDNWDIGNEYLPSIIPDPRQATFTRCRLSTDGTYYHIHLPPRTPLSFTGDKRPYRYPNSSESTVGTVPGNFGTAPGSPWKFFHHPTNDAIADKHYRYRFPKEIEDNISSLTAITGQIPRGLIYLWDNTTNTIVRDALFYKSNLVGSEYWTLIVSSSSAASDFATVAAASTDESEASYNANARYSIITVGASIANTLKFLYKLGLSHTHNDPNDLSPVISHNALADDEPSSSIAISPSYWTNDPHVGLLHRTGTGDSRDLNDNAMLGDLVIAGAVATAAGNKLHNTGDSHKIYFGSTSGPSIYSNVNTLTINSDVVFNETGADKDLRIEGNTDQNLLFVDASTDRVGIGTNTPTSLLSVSGDMSINGEITNGLNVSGGLVADGNVVFNEASAAVNFRIESNGDANLFYVDGTNNRVGIGTNTPSTLLDVDGSMYVDGNIDVNGDIDIDTSTASETHRTSSFTSSSIPSVYTLGNIYATSTSSSSSNTEVHTAIGTTKTNAFTFGGSANNIIRIKAFLEVDTIQGVTEIDQIGVYMKYNSTYVHLGFTSLGIVDTGTKYMIDAVISQTAGTSWNGNMTCIVYDPAPSTSVDIIADSAMFCSIDVPIEIGVYYEHIADGSNSTGVTWSVATADIAIT